MTPVDAVLIVLAGLAAGTINTVVGSGSLITFPALLALGYPPVVANVSNNIGLVPGGISGVWGYRRELAGSRAALLRLAPWSAAGGLLGAVLLLVLPAGVFTVVVVVLIALALVLVVVQPWVSARLKERPSSAAPTRGRVMGLSLGMFAASIYGGYFGAAQGVLYVALISLLLNDDLQQANAIKNVLATVVNGVAAITFILFAHPSWEVVGLIALGSTVGGQLGARVGRLLAPRVLRAVIVVVGVVAIVAVLR
ncbi:MAG: sulfite exporter TauE/SafE family protein [Mycobacteriaceae bacterium]